MQGFSPDGINSRYNYIPGGPPELTSRMYVCVCVCRHVCVSPHVCLRSYFGSSHLWHPFSVMQQSSLRGWARPSEECEEAPPEYKMYLIKLSR